MKLSSALQAAAEADGAGRSSPQVRARLVAEVRALGRRRRRRMFVTVAAAAVVVVAVVIAAWRMMPPAPIVAEGVTPFFPLIAGTGGVSTHIVRIEVPRRALASFGLLTRELDRSSSETVMADVMVGDDGLARAVRFVQPAEQERRQ